MLFTVSPLHGIAALEVEPLSGLSTVVPVGFFKNLMMEQHDSGFFTERYFDEVCQHCIDDPALAAFVAGHGPIEQCGFCGRTELLGSGLGTLFHFMAECLGTEWDDPNNEVGWDHGFHDFITLIDSDELLVWELDSPLGNEDLHKEFVSAFEHLWCQADPYRLGHAEVLLHSWHHFSSIVKNKKRYLLHRMPPKPRDHAEELLDPAEVLDAIGDAIVQADSQVLRRTSDVRIVRARRHERSKRARTAKKLGSPPSRHARHNRMSGAGISMFYGAETEHTAKVEVPRGKGKAVTTGSWTPSRELIYLDLPAALPIPSIFDTAARSKRTSLRFLYQFAQDLARHINEDEAAVEYIPTQFVTEYIRDHLRTGDGQSIDAIRYHSASDEPDGVCWVVFVDNDNCVNSDSRTAKQARGREDLFMILDTNSVRREDS